MLIDKPITSSAIFTELIKAIISAGAEAVVAILDLQETTLVARCELHSVAEVKGSEILLTINALNEFDSRITGVDWRQKIENQRGAVSDCILSSYSIAARIGT